jgi:hypothetical protein
MKRKGTLDKPSESDYEWMAKLAKIKCTNWKINKIIAGMNPSKDTDLLLKHR